MYARKTTEATLRFVRHSIGAAITLAVAAISIPLPAQAQLASLNFKGFNYVSYYNGGYANADSMPALVTTGANAVALSFEYGIDVNTSTVYADPNYTEASSVIASTIAEANSRGLNVMVRPLIDFLDPSKIGSYSVGDWRSTYNPTNAATFFASYKSMIVSVAQLAQANGAASLSIGVELDQLTGPAYQSYWTGIITAVRAVFSGKLTYSSEWGDNQSPWQGSHGLPAGTGNLTTQVSFWSQLDYLGIDAYPPISDAASPTVSQLVAGWTQTPTVASTLATTGNQSLISYFASVATATGLPLIFTELGYESATDAASQPFATSTNAYDPSLQSNLYAAFFEAWRQSGNATLTGVYFWNWDPNAAEVGPGNGANFSPQGEPAQAVVTANFGGSTPALQVSPANDIAATGLQGGPFTPSSFAFQFQATTGSVTYTVSGTPSWLTASSTSGAVTMSATTVTLSTNANAATLSPGSYSATITFTDTTNSDIILALSAVLSVSQSTYTLSVSVTGSGTVTSSPSGINCGSTCSASFAAGTQVILDATPSAGSSFSGWSGACSGSGSCVVTMTAAENVSAPFTASGGGSGGGGGGGGGSNGQSSSVFFVSAKTGTDTGRCLQTAPCQTLNYALSQAAVGSTITIEDAGIFGPIYLTGAIAINGPASQAAAIVNNGSAPGCIGASAGSCASGDPNNAAIEIAAGDTDEINLSNLTADAGAGGIAAIRVDAADSVSLDSVSLRANAANTSFTALLYDISSVQNSNGSPHRLFVHYCDIAASSVGGGILVAPSVPTAASLNNSQIHDVKFGVNLNAASLSSGSSINAVIDRMRMFGFSTNAIVVAAQGAGVAAASVSRSTIMQTGISAVYVGGNNATAFLYDNVINYSPDGIQNAASAGTYSLGNNSIDFNGTNVSGTLSEQPQQ
jgi:hypothetical protein